MEPLPGTTPFDAAPGFYLEDNRQHRTFNPITKSVLEAKMGCLIPEWVVRGKSILDLGSCLGAAGHWALSYGAERYVGVEMQPDYVEHSRTLLSRWGDKALVVESGIRPYLQAAPEKCFDVVLVMGVLYLFLDPDAIVADICRVAVETVAVESIFPRLGKRQVISDASTAVLSYGFNQDVNMSDGNYSLRGLAATPSPGALDIYFRRASFVNREGLLEYPHLTDTSVYSSVPDAAGNVTGRFGARYHRVHHQRDLRTLEDCMPNREGARRPWDAVVPSAAKEEDIQAMKQTVASHGYETPWVFDEQVARNFDHIARTSIPHYDQVIEKSIEIIQKTGFTDPKVIDVGSAIGTTLSRLYTAGFHNLYGVDNSHSMLDHSFRHATLVCSPDFPQDLAPFHVVLANWVLHFISDREQYLSSIAASLAPGGLLILSEKVVSTPMCHDLYHDFKRGNGLSESDIETKQSRLRGVLTPYPLQWYLATLPERGFESVEVIDAHYSFVTILARKARA
jgi:SAM-dependent methyltransferase